MIYNVAQSNGKTVVIQANIGNMKRESDFIDLMRDHMDTMAVKECTGKVRLSDERISVAGLYHTWLERTYACK